MSLCEILLEISNISFEEYKQDITEYISGFIINIINCNDKDANKDLVSCIVSSNISLSVSEHVILRLLSNSGIWHSGTYKGIQKYTEDDLRKMPVTPENLIVAKDLWLATVKRSSENRNILNTEPKAISIFFRWGQLNDNNYEEVQNYIDCITRNNEGLIHFWGYFNEGKGLEGIEKLLKDITSMISRLENLDESLWNKQKIIDYLNALQTRKKPIKS